MANIDLGSHKWLAIRAMVEMGVPVHLIGAVGTVTPRFVLQMAEKGAWASAMGPPAPAPTPAVDAPDAPDGFRARLMAAVSRRVGALAMDEAADPEGLARSLTALVKSTDAAGKLAAAFGNGKGEAGDGRATGGDGTVRGDDKVRLSLRRKLQAFAARARREG